MAMRPWDVFLAEDGPDSWQRVEVGEEPTTAPVANEETADPRGRAVETFVNMLAEIGTADRIPQFVARSKEVVVLDDAGADEISINPALDLDGSAREYRVALVAIDGVYSMTGALPPLEVLNEVCQRHNAVLYVDDAHATAVYALLG